MKILDDIIATLDFKASAKDIRQGVFHTGVLSRHCGLAANLTKDALKQNPPMVSHPGTLLDKPLRELTALAYSEKILEAAIGMATVNSLIEVDMSACVERNAAEILLAKANGKTVAVVGHFPFIPELRTKARRLYVIENNPREDDHPAHEAANLIPEADVVAITGTALTNHSLDKLIRLCPPRAYIIMLGDTVPMSPVLFDYRVDAVSGTRVYDPDLALRCISQGANFRQIKGTLRLTMTRSP